MKGCFVHKCGTILLACAIIIVIIEETTANQLDVAKKYGKRFGNKNKTNGTETKETEKSVTKPIAMDVTKPPLKASESVTEATISRQKYTYSRAQTTTTSGTTTTPGPTTVSVKSTDATEEEIQEEVDVDLSQLQVSLPNVKFDCTSRPEGYYGDPDYRCEVFHYCGTGGKRDTFLCPSNSKFNQKDMTCDTDALDDLCQAEPVWGNNHLYPTPGTSVSHVMSHDFNGDRDGNRDRMQIEVTAPKFETKENGFREPIYETKSLDNSRRVTPPKPPPTPPSDDTYVDTKIVKNDSQYPKKEGNSEANNQNNYSNNESNDGNSNSEDTNPSRDIKANSFGGNFGERQRNPSTSSLPSSSSSTTTNTGVNERKSTQTHYHNNQNGNSVRNGVQQTHGNDFGTVSDAFKKAYKEKDNGNGNNRQSVQPIHSTHGTHGTTDSNHYPSNTRQSFTPNSFESFDRLNKPNTDFNSVRNTNGKNTYDFSYNTDSHIPSAAPEKSYLSPPVATERPSVAPPPAAPQSQQKYYTSARQKPYEPAVRHVTPTAVTRPAIKWPKKQPDYVPTERLRPEPSAPPTPPIVYHTTTTTTTPFPRHYRPPVVEEYTQKTTIIESQSPKAYELSPDIFHKQEPIDDYQPKYRPAKNGQPVIKSKPIQMEKTEIHHPNWSPVNNNQYNGQPVQQNQMNKQKPTPKAPTFNTWVNGVDPKKNQQQREPERQQFMMNKEPEVYTYPPLHHTIGQLDVNNNLWSDDKGLQYDDNYRPNEPSNDYKPQMSHPLKPKWAQEMEDSPQYQTLSVQTQPPQPQPSQSMPDNGFDYKPNAGIKNKDVFHNMKKFENMQKYETTNSGNRFGTQPLRGYEFTVTDYFDQKGSLPAAAGPAPVHQPLVSSQRPDHQINFFYDQFKPYKFAENSPAEYTRNLNENQQQLLKQSLYYDDNLRQKENINNNFNMNTKTNQKKGQSLVNPGFDTMKYQSQQVMTSLKPTLMDELKMEKEMMSGSKLMSGQYVPEMLSEEEYPMSMNPETHVIPKLHKDMMNEKSNKQMIKHGMNRFKPTKQQLFTQNLFDELMAGENGWPLKALDTQSLETAFSHNIPIPISLPNRGPKAHKHHHQKNRFPQAMITHLTAPNRLVPRLPSPQPAFYIPQHMPFPHHLQSQPSIPVHYIMPYYPTPRHRSHKSKKHSKNRSSPKVKH